LYSKRHADLAASAVGSNAAEIHAARTAAKRPWAMDLKILEGEALKFRGRRRRRPESRPAAQKICREIGEVC